MPAVSRIVHAESLSGTISATTSYSSGTTFWALNSQPGTLGAIELHGSAVAGGATKLTIQAFRDAALDQEVIPETQVTFSTGVTTATKWSATVNLGISWAGGASAIFLRVKTDAGTLTLSSALLSWYE